MDLRELIGWIFEGMGAFIMLIPLLFLGLYVLRALENPDYAVTGSVGLVVLLVPFLIMGGLIALFGYFVKRPRTVSTQQTTQDITILKPMTVPPPPPIKRVVACLNCRGENDAANVFCSYCGRRLRKE